MEIKIFNVLYKIVIGCKIELKKANPFSSQMYNFFGFFFVEKLNNKALLLLTFKFRLHEF